MRLDSIQIGQPRTAGDPAASDPLGRPFTSAIWKQPVHGPVALGPLGLEGDAVADRKHHGGPWRAVLMYAADHYPRWREEWGRDVGPGAFGENLTAAGLDEASACLGDHYRIGAVELAVTSPRTPCHVLARRHGIKDLVPTVMANHRHGWYLRVVVPGTLEAGLPMELVARPHPDWPIARAAAVKWHAEDRRPEAEALMACEALIPEWREELAVQLRR